MRLLFLVVVLFFSFVANAQQIQLKIVENSVYVKNDTLNFKVRFINRTNFRFVLYSFSKIRYLTPMREDYPQYINYGMFVSVVDLKNNYSLFLKYPDIDPNKPPLKSKINYDILILDRSHCLSDCKLSLTPLLLKKGRYKFFVTYFSNSKYLTAFKERKKSDKRFAKTTLYRGVVNSNIIYFDYPVVLDMKP